MITYLRLVLLGFPLLWFASIWLTTVFGYSFGLGEKEFSSVYIENIWFLWTFLGTPISAIVGTIYSLRNKYWWWFSLYMLLGILPLFVYFGAVFLSMLSR